MKITFLGTCSGTEPMPGFRHVSFVIEHNDKVYWFDAGDNCSYAAHTGSIDLLKTRAVFISHTHMDHIGGLPNLLWNIRKLNTNHCANPTFAFNGKKIDVFMPHDKTFPAIMEMLKHTEGNFEIDFSINENIYDDGVIFEEDGLKVSAFHNNHLAPADGKWTSFSFLVEANGKSLVYSGDVKSIEDIEHMIRNVDLVLMETGHHLPENICEHLAACDSGFGKLAFVHHGRAILNDFDGELRKARNILGDKVFIATDGMTFEI